jgi:hypothetical protein
VCQEKVPSAHLGSGGFERGILSPSFDQEHAFDNCKVGNCRVHRNKMNGIFLSGIIFYSLYQQAQ